MIPSCYAQILFGFVLSGLMSCILSGLSTWRALGLEGVFGNWMGNWIVSWAVAFPVVLVVAPIAQRMVARLVRQP